MIEYGLKSLPEQIKGMGVRGKLREIFWQLRYAWKRAWKGYDDVDVFAISDRFRDRMILTLTEFKENNYCLFWVPQDSEYYDELGSIELPFTRRCFNKDDTDLIISMMIWHLKMMDADFVEKQIFGANIEDDDYDYRKRTMEDYRRIDNVVRQNKKAFMKLFYLFYDNLYY